MVKLLKLTVISWHFTVYGTKDGLKAKEPEFKKNWKNLKTCFIQRGRYFLIISAPASVQPLPGL